MLFILNAVVHYLQQKNVPCIFFKIELTLKVSRQVTHGRPKHERPHQHWNDVKRHTEHSQEEVAEGQVQQEHVGHGPHPLVLDQGGNDKDIAQEGQNKDDGVGHSGGLRAEGGVRGVPTGVVHLRNTRIIHSLPLYTEASGRQKTRYTYRRCLCTRSLGYSRVEHEMCLALSIHCHSLPPCCEYRVIVCVHSLLIDAYNQ